MQQAFHLHQLVALAFEHLGDRDTRPLRYHFSDFLFGHLAAQQLVFSFAAVLIDHLQAALQVGNDPVLQLSHAVEVTAAACHFKLLARLLDLLLDLRRTLHFGFFRGPDFFQVRILALKTLDFFLQFLKALFRCLVFFFLECLRFNLELNQAALQTVQYLRLGVDLHADTAGRLVDQVNRLVGQLTISDIAMAELGRGNDCTVGNSHLVVNLITLFEATQDRDGVFFARLFYQYFLETTLKRCVLLDVLAVLVERCGTYTVQLTPRQRRLEHVARVHCALALAGTDHYVQFVDKQDDLPFLFRQLVEQCFKTLFELTTELGTSNQRTNIQRQQAFAFEAVRHFAVDDPLGQTFGNRGFTHARFTDQYRVVFGTTLQDLNGAANFIVTTNDRVELAFFGALGQVDGVFIQRLTRLFDVRVVDRFATAQVVDGVFQGFLGDALAQQQFAQLAVVVHGRQQHHFAGDVLIAFLLRQPVCLVQQTRQILRHIHVASRILDFWQLIELFSQFFAQAVYIKTDLHQQRLDRTALLFQQCLHQVRGLNRRMIEANGQ